MNILNTDIHFLDFEILLSKFTDKKCIIPIAIPRRQMSKTVCAIFLPS